MSVTLYDLEMIDPGHIDSRSIQLNRLRDKLIRMGYTIQPITHSDMECFWVTVVYEGIKFHIDHEDEIDIYIEEIKKAKIKNGL